MTIYIADINAVLYTLLHHHMVENQKIQTNKNRPTSVKYECTNKVKPAQHSSTVYLQSVKKILSSPVVFLSLYNLRVCVVNPCFRVCVLYMCCLFLCHFLFSAHV